MDELFKQLFYQHFQNLCSYAFTITKDTIAVKDIVQTAYVKLWEKRGEVNMQGSAKAYLYTSVYRLSLNALRNRKAQVGHQAGHQDITNGKYNVLEEKEIHTRIQQTINRLPDRCKEVFCKSRFEGKKYLEISEDMGISVKTVEAQMGKALKFLRTELSDLVICLVLFF